MHRRNMFLSIGLVIVMMLAFVITPVSAIAPTFSMTIRTQDYIDEHFTRSQLDKLADLYVYAINDCPDNGLENGDVVYISYGMENEELVQRIYEKLQASGYRVIFGHQMDDAMDKKTTDDQYFWVQPGTEELVSTINVALDITNPQKDPFVVGTIIGGYESILNQREKEGECGHIWTSLPNTFSIMNSGLSVAECYQEIERALFLDQDDPVKCFVEAKEKLKQHKENLDKITPNIDYLHFQSTNMDLTMEIGENRQWLYSEYGNMPSFEVYTSPDYRTINGTIGVNIPSILNNIVFGEIKLTFVDGEITEIECGDYLKQVLDAYQDYGAKRIGEIALVDKNISPIRNQLGNPMYNENIGGTMHFALGRAFSEAYLSPDGVVESNSSTLIDLFAIPIRDIACSMKLFSVGEESIYSQLGFNSVDSPIHIDFVNNDPDIKVTAYFNDGTSRIIFENGELVQ